MVCGTENSDRKKMKIYIQDKAYLDVYCDHV